MLRHRPAAGNRPFADRRLHYLWYLRGCRDALWLKARRLSQKSLRKSPHICSYSQRVTKKVPPPAPPLAVGTRLPNTDLTFEHKSTIGSVCIEYFPFIKSPFFPLGSVYVLCCYYCYDLFPSPPPPPHPPIRRLVSFFFHVAKHHGDRGPGLCSGGGVWGAGVLQNTWTSGSYQRGGGGRVGGRIKEAK